MALCIRIARRYQGSIGDAEVTIPRSGADPSGIMQTIRRLADPDTTESIKYG